MLNVKRKISEKNKYLPIMVVLYLNNLYIQISIYWAMLVWFV